MDSVEDNILTQKEENKKKNENRVDARIWIVTNQFGRRNLTDFVSSKLALELKKLFRQKSEKTRLANLKQFKNQGPTECPLGDTRYKTDEEKNRDRVDAQIAKTAGVSRHQIQRTEKILEKGSPEDIKKLESGDITIGEIYKKIRKQEHQKTLKEHQLPEGKYRLLYVDPPWKLGSEPVASTSPEALGYYDQDAALSIALSSHGKSLKEPQVFTTRSIRRKISTHQLKTK